MTRKGSKHWRRAVSRRHALVRVAALASILALSAGCRLFRAPGIAGERFPLIVRNNGYFDVVITALQSGGTSGARIGNVTGNSSASLTIRSSDLQPGGVLVLRLHAIGTNRTWNSPAVTVGPSTQIRLDIYSDASGSLSRSSLYTIAIPDTSLTR
jgi:hypothetical protein